MHSAVPTLDFAAVESATFARSLGEAFADFGFVVIANHGISPDLTKHFLRIYQQFFSLPVASKLRYHVKGGGGARGYTPFGIETAKGAQHHDLKEFWHMGRELPPDHPYCSFMPANIWVQELANFQAVNLQMFTAFDLLGRELLKAIARSLELPVNFFEDKVDQGNSVLRVIHYPPLPATPTESVRAGAHEDINVITLLMGAEEPGLQVRTRQGDWLPINPQPGQFVVNVGDMLQRLTNQALRSTSHRVINPPQERASVAR